MEILAHVFILTQRASTCSLQCIFILISSRDVTDSMLQFSNDDDTYWFEKFLVCHSWRWNVFFDIKAAEWKIQMNLRNNFLKMWDLRLGMIKGFRKKRKDFTAERLWSSFMFLSSQRAHITERFCAESFSRQNQWNFWRSTNFHCPKYAGFLPAKTGIPSIYAKLYFLSTLRRLFISSI